MHNKNILGEIDTHGDNAHDFSPPDGLDENDTFHLGTFEAACGNFTSPSGRGSPFHSLGIKTMTRVSNEQKNLNRLAGEFLAASRLTQRGFIAQRPC